MTIQKREFGKCQNGQAADLYTLTGPTGLEAKITNYGGHLTNLLVKDRDGRQRDVVIGFDSLHDYEVQTAFIGAVVGRCANRITGGRFTLDGRQYMLDTNNGTNHLHGGVYGFNRRLWQAEQTAPNSLKLTLFSPDMDQGYPGNLIACVIYTVTDNALDITYRGFSDQRTLFNMTHHAYFNLGGQSHPTILDHELLIRAGAITEIDQNLSATGKLLDVEHTPFDFRKAKTIGQDIQKDDEQVRFGLGYDHNFALDQGSHPAAELYCPETGIDMKVLTDMPGIQLYTGNQLTDSITLKGGRKAEQFRALCLETQYFPDAINHDNFEQPILNAGECVEFKTSYVFSVRQ